MKLSNFRVRDLAYQKYKAEHAKEENNKLSHQPNDIKNNDDKLSTLLQSFENIMTAFVSLNSQKHSHHAQNTHHSFNHAKDLEPRDRFITIDLPDLLDTQYEEQKFQKLEGWIGTVCKESMSIAFNYLMKKKVNYEQMKAFACQNFLRNIVNLAETYQITPKDIEFIDKQLKNNILPYLKAKYPLTVENEVNKALQNAIKSIDNSQMVTNDYLYTSEVAFAHRQNGRYDDLIMKLLNEIMIRCQAKSPSSDKKKELSNYKDFEYLMTEIFDKSFDEKWMDSVTKEQNTQKILKNQKDQKLAEKYEQKVKEYTSYLIGRKISQNTDLYTEEQIQSQILSIKSPAILRILTKWCEELWSKFDNETFFLQRKDGFSLTESKKVAFVTKQLKEGLMKDAKTQKDKVKKYLLQIDEVNYNQIVQILSNEFENNNSSFIEKKQKIIGKFACKSVKNIEHFIVNYLNRLIHGLMTLSKVVYQQKIIDRYEFTDYPSHFNLLSFNISDLFRCKYASKEKEVLKIFKQIERFSTENPDKFKIIRIKNRLKQGTNDIMINAKFNNTINCEIQIAVNTSHSDFMNCSNKINHFIYELERAQFGPILEMCSIWKTYDKRSDVFMKLIEKQKPKKHKKTQDKSSEFKQIDDNFMITQTNPFICSVCSKHYHQNNFILSHLKSNGSKYWICAPCIIEKRFEGENRDAFFTNDKLKNEYKFWKQKDEIPENGACIFIRNLKAQVIMFRKTKQKFDMKTYLICLKNNVPTILRDITSKKQISQFMNEHLVFQLPEKIIDDYFKCEQKALEKQVDKKILIPEYFKKTFKQQAQGISIAEEQNLSSEQVKQFLEGNEQKLKVISKIELNKVQLENTDFLLAGLQNLKSLNLTRNQIKEITNIWDYKELQNLCIKSNELTQIPQRIENLTKLKDIDFSSNRIREIPQSLFNLPQLCELIMDGNQVSNIAQTLNVDKLLNLRSIIMDRNPLDKFPLVLTRIKAIEKLRFFESNISEIPKEIQNLSQLKSLDLTGNNIMTLPSEIGKLTKLKMLNVSQNKLYFIPRQIGNCLQLQMLNACWNNLEQVPNELRNLKKLQQLALFSNSLLSFDCMAELTSLVLLTLSDNQLKELPQDIDKLTKLQTFDISSNKIKKLPHTISKLNLINFDFFPNPLQTASIQYLPDCLIKQNRLKLSQFKYLTNVEWAWVKPHHKNIKQIDFSMNYLASVPDTVFRLPYVTKVNVAFNDINDQFLTQIPLGCQIKCLILQGNRFANLPSQISRLNQLQTLNLAKNQITVFPETICTLLNLVSLNLESNQIHELPKNLFHFTKLQQLNLEKNKLQEIPDLIGELKCLRKLNMSSNKINQIPSLIVANQSIMQLNLESNEIKTIPNGFCEMKNLSDGKLFLKNNPIQKIYVEKENYLEMIKKCSDWQSIRVKCEQTQKTKQQP